MWYVYILYSKSIDKYYTGYTDNLEWRLERHNAGWGKFSSRGIPWELVYSESFQTKSEAIKRENEIKRWKSRKRIVVLILKAEPVPIILSQPLAGELAEEFIGSLSAVLLGGSAPP